MSNKKNKKTVGQTDRLIVGLSNGYCIDVTKGTKEEFQILRLLLDKFKPIQIKRTNWM